MGLIIAFVIFIGSMITMLITGHSMVWALLIGLVLFAVLGLHRLKTGEEQMSLSKGLRELAINSWGSIKDSLIVIEVMLIIGFITAAWRVSGTITVFVYYGMKVIVPPLFLVITFLLSCLLSYALGTSFGVAGTVGVIFMALARSGGVNPVITAGVIMSGIYFGDRGSPVSSSANMVAGVTKTDILENVRLMMKTAILPFAITLAAYAVLSVINPISHVDADIIQAFENEFTLSPWAFVPAVLMLALPLFKVGVILSISISIVASVAVAFFVEKVPILAILKILVFGYHSTGDGLAAILDGGGLVSMLEIVAILAISCAYSGIFNRTDMLQNLLNLIEKCCTKTGRYATTFIVSVATCVVFCNQTIATLMCSDLLTRPYLNTGGSRQELAIDMENTVIIVVGLIPWCIACSVPLTFFNIGISALPFAFYMYLVPLCYFFTKKRWFVNRVHASEHQDG
ncbi:MAG: sodium:proton antiporter [Clostridia bacterium]|nr:sodium:proton antiporter [Clostridia bacterium]